MRMPKPWFRKASQTWYVQVVNLGPDRDKAFAEYHRLMAIEDPGADHNRNHTTAQLRSPQTYQRAGRFNGK
jgi:hypothetical protein